MYTPNIKSITNHVTKLLYLLCSYSGKHRFDLNNQTILTTNNVFVVVYINNPSFQEKQYKSTTSNEISLLNCNK